MGRRALGIFTAFVGVAGLVVLPVTCEVARRRSWRGQVAVAEGVIALFAGIARWTAYSTPEQAFTSTFRKPIPKPITDVQAYRQYYDGFIVSLAFHATEGDLQTILAGGKFVQSDPVFDGRFSWPKSWQLRARPWVDIVNPGWPNPPAEPATNYYSSEASGSLNFVHVFWDSKTNQTYVLHISD